MALPGDTLVIAHRGAWGDDLPENTLEAFEEAVRLGADMIECDVRRAAEGCLVAQHDPDVAGLLPTRPHLLEQIVNQLAGRIVLNLELKERGCVTEVVELLRGHEVEDCLLTSFLDDVVREAKSRAPHLQTGLVIARPPAHAAVTRAQRCSADCLVLEARIAPPAQLPCLVWTVNDAAAIDRCLGDPSVAGVITDRPGLALQRCALLSGRTAPAERR